MARILVTGATGLIGREAVRALAGRGFAVVAVSRGGAPVPGAVEVLAADLLDPSALARLVREAGASHLLHLAWAEGADRWHSPVNLDWAGASLALLRAFAAAGGKRALGVGSCAEYDWTLPGGRFAEDAPRRPATLYGMAKSATGDLWLKGGAAAGLSVAWARPFFVYGRGEKPGRLLGDLLAGLRAGREVPCTDGLQERDFLHAADLGAALALLAEAGEGAFNAGSGQAVAVRDLIGIAAGLMGRADLVRLGARARPADDPPRIVAEAGRLAALGFRQRFTLAEGLADVVGAGLPVREAAS